MNGWMDERMNGQMNMEHKWNDTDKGKSKVLREAPGLVPFCQPH
jgi:hypothetical protein